MLKNVETYILPNRYVLVGNSIANSQRSIDTIDSSIDGTFPSYRLALLHLGQYI